MPAPVLALFALLLAACSSPAPGSSASASAREPPGGGVDSALVGSWFAGRGGTSAPYDPQTGAWGPPNGSGMIFVFDADGTYTKATEDTTSSGDCTSGYVAFEDGVATTSGSSLVLHPTRGHMQTLSCGASADQPIDVSDETLRWRVAPSAVDPATPALTLADAQGNSAELRRL